MNVRSFRRHGMHVAESGSGHFEVGSSSAAILVHKHHLRDLHILIGQALGILDEKPSLPETPPAGFVRCRVGVSVLADYRWSARGDYDYDDDEQTERALHYEDNCGPDARLSFVTFDAPLPEPPAELVGHTENR